MRSASVRSRGLERRQNLIEQVCIPSRTRSIPGKPNKRYGEVRHHHRRVSLVLVMRTQVQPVSLQTRSSVIPGAP